MTTTQSAPAQGFTALFDALRDGAAERERSAERPHDLVDQIKASGILGLRVPVEHGGHGATLREFFENLIELARADSNLAQALRAHFGYGEQLRFVPEDAARAAFAVLAGGEIVGNAITEPAGAHSGDFAGLSTTFAPDGDDWRITGTKFYSTGTLYADRVWVWGVTPDGLPASAVVPLDRDGITVVDDWDGFGQQASGSGTTHFENTPALAAEVGVAGTEPPPRLALGAFLQLYLTAVIVGNLEAARDDAVAVLQARTRNITHGTAELPRNEPVLLAQVGDIASKAYAARSIVLDVAAYLDEADAELTAGRFDSGVGERAGLRAAEAKVVVDRLALDAATALFDVGGASATRSGANLDRHWRNIRTLASHNPTRLKAQVIGDHVINDAELPDNTYF
ncbi:acyl-CoA dehydrogenase family protein [Gordonia sp. HY442]|uniref:acyl-CoA dehydrogenase family protein n=1 Tax=Gordonia zhenghanii TaxID=2911516 RepID=UPI001F1B518A|nr:acyl-CoA dehydrogenase family protein [Gordonia zhenghanii]MCF8603999.1 acyl-CoA dehydrogenase family protein [Gordonia zhenghanii]